MEKSEQENKYYTPSIEEIHVGFECELFDSPNSTLLTTSKGEWIPSCTVAVLNPLESFTSQIEKETIRVKYLDKSDIEELGFEKREENKLPGETLGHPYDKFTESYRIGGINSKGKPYGATIFYGNTIDPTYIRIEGAVAPGPVHGYIGGQPLFRGNIKNKSELKTLLKWLNITPQK